MKNLSVRASCPHLVPRLWSRHCHEGPDPRHGQPQPEKEETAIVSGIGCASRLPGYIDCCTLHTAHGRAAAFATGVKMARPEMNVILVGGDGDGTAIGGNHFIHACRRNIDMQLHHHEQLTSMA